MFRNTLARFIAQRLPAGLVSPAALNHVPSDLRSKPSFLSPNPKSGKSFGFPPSKFNNDDFLALFIPPFTRSHVSSHDLREAMTLRLIDIATRRAATSNPSNSHVLRSILLRNLQLLISTPLDIIPTLEGSKSILFNTDAFTTTFRVLRETLLKSESEAACNKINSALSKQLLKVERQVSKDTMISMRRAGAELKKRQRMVGARSTGFGFAGTSTSTSSQPSLPTAGPKISNPPIAVSTSATALSTSSPRLTPLPTSPQSLLQRFRSTTSPQSSTHTPMSRLRLATLGWNASTPPLPRKVTTTKSTPSLKWSSKTTASSAPPTPTIDSTTKANGKATAAKSGAIRWTFGTSITK